MHRTQTYNIDQRPFQVSWSGTHRIQAALNRKRPLHVRIVPSAWVDRLHLQQGVGAPLKFELVRLAPPWLEVRQRWVAVYRVPRRGAVSLGRASGMHAGRLGAAHRWGGAWSGAVRVQKLSLVWEGAEECEVRPEVHEGGGDEPEDERLPRAAGISHRHREVTCRRHRRELGAPVR